MRRSMLGLLLAASACGVAEGASDRFVLDSTGAGIPRITSQAPSGWRDSSNAWRLVPAQTYVGEEGTDGALVNPQSLVVDDAGRVYVADQTPATIKVFGPDGTYLKSIGREGKGQASSRPRFSESGRTGWWSTTRGAREPRCSAPRAPS
ncbi:MAG: hypothetical protein R2909_01895 [Gemmatimonadales bacterium]